MLRAMTVPCASVVMPAYNVAPFIRDAVESVLGQSFLDFELIVIDDGSTDETWDRLASVKDPRLQVIRQDNLGSSSARNAGIRRASGRYIGFVDGDDLWMPGKLEAHVDFLERHSEVDLTFSRSAIIDEGGNRTGRASYRASGEVSFRQLLVENVVNNGSAVVMRRDALELAGYFDTGLKACVDWDLWLRVALLRQHNIYCLGEEFTKYRMRSGQVTKNWRRMEGEWTKMFAKIRLAAGPVVDSAAAEARARFYRYLGYLAYENRDYSNSLELLLSGIRSAARSLFFDRRTWVLAAALAARALLPGRMFVRCDALGRHLRSRRPLRLVVNNRSRT